MYDAAGLRVYSSTLSAWRRAHLRSATTLVTREVSKRIKASVTPGTVDEAQAALCA
jgi:hypothetical protein